MRISKQLDERFSVRRNWYDDIEHWQRGFPHDYCQPELEMKNDEPA